VGASCQNILTAASLLGFASQWLTEWYAYDEAVENRLGLDKDERVAAFIYIGSAKEKPAERERPSLDSRISRWNA
jgi:nitroreductase